jgi:4-amino-4-deoxy-L-arabinose transferase-like glycosyltransferase
VSAATTSRRLAVATTLGVCVLVAAALRFRALAHGLPLLRGRPDELEVVLATATFPSGDFNPRFFVYPNLFFYVVYVWDLFVLALGRLHGAMPSYATLLDTDQARLIFYGRALTATAGTASVVVMYAVGRRVGSRMTGLVAAALLATNFLHVRDSHALKPDVLLGIAMLVALTLLARHAERPSRRHAIAAGVAVGLTMAIKYNGVFLLVPTYVEDVLASPRRGWRRGLPSADFLALGTAALVAFVVACPFLVVDFGRTAFTSWFLAFTVFATRPATALPPSASWLDVPLHFVRTRAFGYHLTMSLWHGFGALATLAVAPALVLAALRRTPRLYRMAAVFAVAYYLVIGAAPVHLVRYFTALVPVLVLLIAHLVVTLARATSAPATVAALLTVALAAQPLASGIAHDRIAAKRDTRLLAADWMRLHLPAGANVAVLGTTLFAYADPELPENVHRVQNGLAADEYVRAGVTHVVTHEHRIPFSRLDPKQMAALAPHLRLLVEFSPFTGPPAGGFEDEDAFYIPFYDFAGVVRPGPLVRIYAYDATPAPTALAPPANGVIRDAA